MTFPIRAKPFEVTKREVYSAWLLVKANKGAGGTDGESLEKFEAKLSKNLYKLWNRMSSGSYFPQAVRRVEIPKKDGGTRPLGIPTVSDRIAQQVVRARLEPRLERIFRPDSYGYRPGKSAIEAVGTCRKRCWEFDWVLDLDIQKFFDTIDHELLLKAVRMHCDEPWLVLYIERWLKAPIRHADGKEEPSVRGTPQGGVISPLLANLYLHYAFDYWMEKTHPSVKFERFADDIVIHCKSEGESMTLKDAIGERLSDCGLRLHPEKTRTVYCRDSTRRGDYSQVTFTFLGYTFKPRGARNKRTGKTFTGFLPAVSREAQKQFRHKLRAKQLRRCVTLSVEEVAVLLNPMLRGWLSYFSHYYVSELWWAGFHIDNRLMRWARSKYKWKSRRPIRWLNQLKANQPNLFAHWSLLSQANGCIGRAG